ncbi:Protein TANC2 [Varanus komodoensis]|nr:Protein TANC2 [Varanus komodoensis]
MREDLLWTDLALSSSTVRPEGHLTRLPGTLWLVAEPEGGTDGGSEEPPDRRQASIDYCQSHSGQGGGSTENDSAYEQEYAIPTLPVPEGMQHIRIMEGMSRSLPSSPLLTHQSISVRLQPMKRLTAPLRKAKFVESPRIPESELGSPTLSSAPKLDLDAYCPGKHACRASLERVCSGSALTHIP